MRTWKDARMRRQPQTAGHIATGSHLDLLACETVRHRCDVASKLLWDRHMHCLENVGILEISVPMPIILLVSRCNIAESCSGPRKVCRAVIGLC